MTTDTSERGLERLICMALCGHPCDGTTQTGITHEQPTSYAARPTPLLGWHTN